MEATSPEQIAYRGVSISIKVDENDDGSLGLADLFEKGEFKARLALRSDSRAPTALRDRLRCLAKAKIDTWAVTRSA